MADRRAQLLEAMKEHTDDDEETVVDDDSSDESVDANDESVLAAETKDSTVDDGAGKDAATDGGAVVRDSDEKSASRSAPDKSGKSASGKGVSAKADASKGAKNDADAKALEDQERKAAEEVGEAPRSWKIATREHWSKLPKEVREQIQTRETEITQFIGRHGAAIQHKAQFDETVQPFLPFIAAQQSTPMKAFHSLMTTAARLTTGAPHAKAQVIAEIIRNYGVDLSTLDEVLSQQLKGGPPVGPQNSGMGNQPPAWAQPIFNFMQETQQARQAREERTRQEAAAELAAFEKKPFFNDLREDIGLIMERASAKGEVVTIQQAYDKARKMNPEVDKILTQREKAGAANGGTPNPIARARRAASTVQGAPGASTVVRAAKVNGQKPLTRREQLMQSAIDLETED